MKKTVSAFLCILLCINLVPMHVSAGTAVRDTSFETALAGTLKSLGLFKGVSDTNFDLGRAPTRTEAMVMLIRVLGKESEVLGNSWTHPFTDVDTWANQYVGYAYTNKLSNGVSSTQFGSGTATANMYLTFVLRALGYSDTNGADFTWDNPTTLAKRVGILPDCVDTSAFWRADVVLVSYAALSVPLKGSSETLGQKLIAAGVFTQAQFGACYDAAAISDHLSTVKAKLSATEIYAKCSPAVFYIGIYNSAGTMTASGSGFFIDSAGTAVTNYHVIEGCSSAKIVTSDTGKTYDVLGVYDYSEEEDWAVIKVDGSGFSFLKPADSSSVVGGATVYAIGSPLGLQNTISEGLISNPNRTEGGVTYIQTSAAISSGSSGGALIDTCGDVVGITSAFYVDGQNLNLALPISYISGCAQSDVTALVNLTDSAVSATYSKEHHLAAFNLLRDWILKNYNEETDSGVKGYQETFTNDYGYYDYLIAYDAGDNSITFAIHSLYKMVNTYSFITVDNSSLTDLASFSWYDENDVEIFSGYSWIHAPSLNEDMNYTFSDYEGNTGSLSDFQDIAKYMYLSSISFADYVFQTYLKDSGYGISDFGFANIT